MKKILYGCILTGALLFLWIIGGYYLAGPLEKQTTVVFPPNTHFSTIADQLAENHIISHPFLFKVIVFLSGQSGRVKAGEYEFPAGVSANDVAHMLVFGKVVLHRLTIPEGTLTSEIVTMVQSNPLLVGEITLDIKEGELLPETYNYSRGDKRNDILEHMHHAMQKALAEAWDGHADNLPLINDKQLLILASIVEKETALPSERPHVASVYINRLRKNMLLQADPTTAYAVTRGRMKLDRPLTLKDLEINSLYNTYKFPGLPPGPICNPGKMTLIASAHPIQSDDLYFVATGTGGHYFARTVEEHAVNVKRYRQSKKE